MKPNTVHKVGSRPEPTPTYHHRHSHHPPHKPRRKRERRKQLKEVECSGFPPSRSDHLYQMLPSGQYKDTEEQRKNKEERLEDNTTKGQRSVLRIYKKKDSCICLKANGRDQVHKRLKTGKLGYR